MPYLAFRPERPIRGVPAPDPAQGEGLALWIERADEVARARGAAALSDLIASLPSKSEEAAAVARGLGFEAPAGPPRPARWFDPEAGLATIRALLDRAETHPDDLTPAPPWPIAGPVDGLAPLVAFDLRYFEKCLERAVAQKVRFHFGLGL